jgi:hypothetical protein
MDDVRVTGDDGVERKPQTQLHVLLTQDVVDGTMPTYFLLHSGVSPSFKGDTAARVRATRTYSMPIHFC